MKHFYIKFLLVACFTTATILTTQAQINIVVSEDTYISSRPAEQDDDRSAQDELQGRVVTGSTSDGERIAFMKFDLSGLSGTITSAKLQFYSRKTDTGSDVGMQLFEYANDTWTDIENYDSFGGLTDSFGTIGSQLGSDIALTSTSEGSQFVEVDVLSYIQTEYAGDQTVTIAARREPGGGHGNGVSIRISSKETTTAGAAAPTLVLEGVTLSNNDFSISKFAMYPNPTSERLNIEANVVIQKAVVYSVLGKRVLNVDNINNSKTELDVRGLNKGIYFVKLTDDNGATSTKKFLKQ